jgi:hypothetical protein
MKSAGSKPAPMTHRGWNTHYSSPRLLTDVGFQEVCSISGPDLEAVEAKLHERGKLEPTPLNRKVPQPEVKPDAISGFVGASLSKQEWFIRILVSLWHSQKQTDSVHLQCGRLSALRVSGLVDEPIGW